MVSFCHAPAVRVPARLLARGAAAHVPPRGGSPGGRDRPQDQRRGGRPGRHPGGSPGDARASARLRHSRLPDLGPACAPVRRAGPLLQHRRGGFPRLVRRFLPGPLAAAAGRAAGRTGAPQVRQGHVARNLGRRAAADARRPGRLTPGSDSHRTPSCRDFLHKEVVMVRSILSFLSMLLWAPALALAQAGQGSPGSPGNARAGTGARAGDAAASGGSAWVWWIIVAIIVLAIIWWAAGSGRRRRPAGP